MTMTIYDMQLHDEIKIEKNVYVLRVAGGWIYRYEASDGVDGWNIETQFVPYDNEFQKSD